MTNLLSENYVERINKLLLGRNTFTSQPTEIFVNNAK